MGKIRDTILKSFRFISDYEVELIYPYTNSEQVSNKGIIKLPQEIREKLGLENLDKSDVVYLKVRISKVKPEISLITLPLLEKKKELEEEGGE
jgi:bifunctional DNA-binding transcriptional regulator/antitoxin component of YhaV-PrlF toxin-antitoxin module